MTIVAIGKTDRGGHKESRERTLTDMQSSQKAEERVQAQPYEGHPVHPFIKYSNGN
jgi:hypothetical protein